MTPDELEKAMKESAARLDGQAVPTPGFAYFENLVETQQAALRRGQRVQMALFIAVALALVAGLLLCMGASQVFFPVLQGVAMAGTALGLLAHLIKSGKPKEGAEQCS